MGLGDQISRIIIDVKAETKGARQQLGELNQALEAMGKIAQFARDAIREYGEHTRLSAASAGINIEKLSASFKGLINEHDLLTFASRTSHGAFKLTQAEMLKVGEAAVALRNRGFDLNEAVTKLTTALVKGKTEGLDDFGLSVENADTKAGRLKNIMGELDRVVKETGTSTADYADDITRLANEWDNATAAIKRYTVEALKGMPVDGKGGLFGQARDALARGKGDADSFDEIQRRALQGGSADVTSTVLNAFDAERNRASMAQAQSNLLKGVETGKQNILDRYKPDKAKSSGKSESVGSSDFFGGIQSSIRAGMSDAIAALDTGTGRIATTTGGIVEAGAFRIRNEGMEQKGRDDARADFQKQVDEFRQLVALAEEEKTKARQKSVLTSLFGEHSEVDIWIESFQRLGSVFAGFGEAVGASYEAIVTGQGSASAAFKKVLADSLMATGKQSAVKAIQELALAAGAAAYGNLPSAGLHLKSAGLHTAVAVAAGAAANALGTSAQVAASDKAAADKAKEDEKAKKEAEKRGGSSGGGGSGSGGSDKSRPVVVVLGSSFDETTPRQRARVAQQALDKAIRERDE